MPTGPDALQQAEKNVTFEIDNCSRIDAFLPSRSTEKSEDGGKNISDSIMQYDVHYGSELEGEPGEFVEFNMKFLSAYVKEKLMSNLDLKKLADMLNKLRTMFMGRSQSHRLFEFLIFDMLSRTDAVGKMGK